MDTAEEKRIQEILLKNIGPIKKRKKKYNWWKPIVGYEKLYEVCKFGKVRCRGFRRDNGRMAKRRNLTSYLSRGAATIVLIGKDGKRKAFPLKNLVYKHWIGPLNGRYVKLKDGNPFNCATSNIIKHKNEDKI